MALSLSALGSVGSAFAASGPDFVKDPASLVNPIIGTSGAVNTFPGPDMPFGMLQWGPDTTPHRTQGGGYEYKDSKISGFSLAHVSGPGCDVAGDVPILPVSGALSGDLSATAASFTHADEQTGIGYYGVTDASGVKTELTDTTRSGLGRFTFPAGAQSNLLLKLSSGATTVDGTRVRTVSDHEVSGSVDSGHFCGAKNHYTLHFDIRFGQPFTGSGTWVGSTINPDATSLSQGRAPQTPATHATGPLHEQHFTVPSHPAPTVHGSQAASAAAAPVTGANGMYLTFDTSKRRR
jgi:putative alpha-1,2-mannosidase